MAAASKKYVTPAATMLTAAGVTSLPSRGAKSIPAGVATRVAALEMLRHLGLVKQSGKHKVWGLSLPESHREWPDLKNAAATLNAGLKKIAAVIESTFLLFTDMPMDRGDATKASTNASCSAARRSTSSTWRRRSAPATTCSRP